jgi:hypothetical protein
MKTMRFILSVILLSFSAFAAEKPPIPSEDDGFVSIFNGKDLSGWDGDPRLWTVADGVLRGQTTPENAAKGNTFCIWRGGKVKDFALKVKFRIENGNSGIQYRSIDKGKWVVAGYQAEVENAPGKVGFLYHESGRGWLVNVGDMMRITEEGEKLVVGKVSDKEQIIKDGYYKEKDWNEYAIFCRGNHVMHYLNGYPTVELIDDDPNGRLLEGILALQIHAGPPMLVEFKDIRLKTLTENYAPAVRLFNGEDFTGWRFSSDGQKEAWSVKDGVLATRGNPGGYIKTEKEFTNYVLRLQLRHLGTGNGGVLLRVNGPDKVWPKSIEAQGQFNAMGDIWNIDEFPMKVDAARTDGRHTRKLHPTNEKPVGQWNDYEIYLNRGDLRIMVNRLLQNFASECQEIPGRVALQSEGSPIEFRNIVLIPIK